MAQQTALQNNMPICSREEAVIQNLKDAGCSEGLIDRFQECCREYDKK